MTRQDQNQIGWMHCTARHHPSIIHIDIPAHILPPHSTLSPLLLSCSPTTCRARLHRFDAVCRIRYLILIRTYTDYRPCGITSTLPYLTHCITSFDTKPSAAKTHTQAFCGLALRISCHYPSTHPDHARPLRARCDRLQTNVESPAQFSLFLSLPRDCRDKR